MTFLLYSHGAVDGLGRLWEQGFRSNAASPGRQAGGSFSVAVVRELLAGRERRAWFGTDVDQTLAGFEAGQGLGAR